MNLKQIKIVDRMDHTLKSPTESDFEALLSGLGAELLAEPTTLADIDETLNGHALVTDSMLLSAITTRRMRLANTMKALVKTLNQNTDPAKGLTAGVTEGMEVDSQYAVLGGAILSKPRKSGLIATMTAEIPFSDGQSVFIIFHAPDDDPAVIGPDDTLIAFRFLLNKRDITDIVAPHNGRDISLKQTALAITRIVERNSNRFRASLRVKADQQKDIETLQSQLDATIAATGDISSQADAKQAEIDAMQSSLDALRARIASQNAVNADLEKALPAAPAVQQPAVAANDDAGEIELIGQKYWDNFTGQRYQATKDLPLSEVAKLVRVAITDGKQSGKYPKELRVTVKAQRNKDMQLYVEALPADFNVFSPAQLAEFSKDPESYLVQDMYSVQMKNLLTLLNDEANEFNRDGSDLLTDYYSRRFDLDVKVAANVSDEFKARQLAGFVPPEPAATDTPPDSKGDANDNSGPLTIDEVSGFTAGNLPPLAGREIGLYVTYDGKSYPVNTIADAQGMWTQFREHIAITADVGASGVGEAVIEDHTGRVIAKISYNSRIWTATEPQRPINADVWAAIENAVKSVPAITEAEKQQGAVSQPAYEMTRDAWIRQQIENNQYAAEYLADAALYNDKAQMLESDWPDELKERAKVGRISDEALNDYVRIFGVDALVSVFRGQYAPGIEGFIPAQPVPEPEAQPATIEEMFAQNDKALAPTAEEPPAADPTAGISPELLEVQRDIDAMEKQQERMKQANAIFRKYQKAKEKDPVTAKEKATAELVAIGYPSTFIDTLRPNFLGNLIPHEGFELTNLNARLKSRRARLEELQQREEAAAEGDLDLYLTFNGAPVNVEVDYGDDRIRVYFPNLKRRATADDPEYAAVQRIASGANWSPTNRAWQRKITRNAKADIAYSLGFNSWDEMVKAGKSAGQAESEPEQPAANLPKGTVVGGEKEIDDLLEFAKTGPGNEKRAVSYATVTDEEAERIKNATGLDVAGYRHVIDNFGIRHAFKRHGNDATEAMRGQAAITEDDIRRIPEIIAAPDSIEYSGQDQTGNELIKYTKQFETEIFYVEEMREKRGELVSKTLWKTRTAPGATSEDGGPQTSETFSRNSPQTDESIVNPAEVDNTMDNENQPPEVQSEITALQSALANAQSADELIDALDQALAVLDSAGEEQHAELIEQASNRITELLEAQ